MCDFWVLHSWVTSDFCWHWKQCTYSFVCHCHWANICLYKHSNTIHYGRVSAERCQCYWISGYYPSSLTIVKPELRCLIAAEVVKWEKVCHMYLCRYDSAQVPAKLISKPYNCSRFKYSILFSLYIRLTLSISPSTSAPYPSIILVKLPKYHLI